MESICCVLSTEYFTAKLMTNTGQYKDKFLIRELALIKNSIDALYQPNCYHFNLRKYKWRDIGNPKSIHFQTNKVHGLNFHPEDHENVYEEDELMPIIRKEYKIYRVPNVAEVIAFKGGNYEKQLLANLKIPFVNLKDFGCPNYDKLKVKFPQQTYEICDHHKIKDGIHCAKVKVTAFRDWIVNNYESFHS